MHATYPGVRSRRIRIGVGLRAKARRGGARVERSATTLRKCDPGKEYRGRRNARVPMKPRASGGRRLLVAEQAPIRGSAPLADGPVRGGSELGREPAEPTRGVAVRPEVPTDANHLHSDKRFLPTWRPKPLINGEPRSVCRHKAEGLCRINNLLFVPASADQYRGVLLHWCVYGAQFSLHSTNGRKSL